MTKDGGEPDVAFVEALGHELAVAAPEPREEAVRRLVALALQADPLTPKGAEVVRHPRILELLAGPGLAAREGPDLGSEAALEALRRYGRPADLGRLGDVLLRSVAARPTAEGLLLLAKAKPPGAGPLLETLRRHPEALEIARAALGSSDLEDRFIAAADAAADGAALAAALRPLKLAGTPRALRAIASRLRSPWLVPLPDGAARSVRLDVLEALLYNFPDEPALYPNNINTDADYAAAERFCEAALGVAYTQPRPPFLKYVAVPHPRP